VLTRQKLAAQFGVFELIDIFGVWLHAPGALLVLALGARRFRSTAAAGLALAIVLFVADFSEMFQPRPSAANSTTLRVMTANLSWTNTDPDAFAAAVAREHPDLLAVQELTWAMAGPLAELLRVSYPYQDLAPDASYTGIGLFSRIPLRIVIAAHIGPAPDACICQSVALSVNGRTIQVLNAHPPAPRVRFTRLGLIPIPISFSTQIGDAARRQLLEWLDARSTPVVLLGDLNTADSQPYYRDLRARLADAHWEAGWGFGWTFPSEPVGSTPIPLVRIDYVLHSAELRAVGEWTGYLEASDHRYVVADLVLRV